MKVPKGVSRSRLSEGTGRLLRVPLVDGSEDQIMNETHCLRQYRLLTDLINLDCTELLVVCPKRDSK